MRTIFEEKPMEPQSLSDHFRQQKERFLNECRLCGQCLSHCQILPASPFGAEEATALQRERLEALRGEGPFSQKAWELTNLCMACLSCRPHCPAGLPTPLLATLLKAEGVQRGMKAPAAYDTFFPKNKFFVTDLMLALQLKPQEVPWIETVPPDPPAADTVLFLGCYNHIQADKILTTIDVLKALKLEFVPLVGDPRTYCCGAIFTLVGDTQGAEEKARALMEAVSAFRPQRLLFWCVGCSWWHREVNAHFLGEPPFEVQNVLQYLAGRVGEIEFSRRIDRTVVVHDSCHLGRGIEEYEAPRRILSAIPGVKRVEMEHSREKGLCCGGAARSLYPKETRKLLEQSLSEARSRGADLLATSCGGCYTAFSEMEERSGVEAQNVIALLGQAMGIEHEDRLKKYRSLNDPQKILEAAREFIEASPFTLAEMEQIVPRIFRKR